MAQRRITLASELQAGTSFLFEVDLIEFREHLLTSLFRHVRNALRDAHVRLAYTVGIQTRTLKSGRSRATSISLLPCLAHYHGRTTASARLP